MLPLILIFAAVVTASAQTPPGRPCPAEPTDMPIVFGDLVRCEISPAGDIDLFRFTGSDQQTILIQVYGSRVPCFSLFDPGNVQIAEQCGSIVAFLARREFRLTRSGTHTIRVYASGNNATFTYELFLQRLNPPLTSTSMVFGQNLSGEIAHVGAIQFYRFQAETGSTVVLQVSGSKVPCFQLLDPGQTQVAERCGTIVSFIARHEFTASKTGTYTIRVFASGFVATMTYTILLQCLSECSTVTVLSAAAGAPPVAPESIASAFGQRLSIRTQAAEGNPLPQTLADTSVKVIDSTGAERPAALFFVSPGQVNFLVPAGTRTGPAAVAITNADGRVSSGSVPVEPVAPGLFSADGSGRGPAAAWVTTVCADRSQSVRLAARCGAGSEGCTAEPVDMRPSEQTILSLFGTGIRGRTSQSAVRATIGGQASEVLFAGAQGSFAGLDQVNVRVPNALAGRGEVSVALTIDGKASNTVTIHVAGVQPPAPRIHAVTPDAAAPGEILTAFTIAGQDLESVAQIEFSPVAGISVLNVLASATKVTAELRIAANASPGSRMLSVVSPTGRSNSLPFSIRSLPSPQCGLVSGLSTPLGPTPAVSGPTLFTNPQLCISVPAGATRLEVRLMTTTPGIEAHLFVRFGSDPEPSDSDVTADHRAEGPGGDKIIVVTLTSSPPLRSGAYHIGIGIVTPGTPANFVLTVTVR